MADIDVPVETAPTAVPAIVNYGDQTLPAIRAGMRRVRAPAQNASDYGPGLVTWIQIDTSQLGAFIDPTMSYLEFDFQISGLTDQQFAMLSNAGAASFIDTCRIYIQGNPVEELMNYGTFVEADNDINGYGSKMYHPPLAVSEAPVNEYESYYGLSRLGGCVPEIDPLEPNDFMGINVQAAQNANYSTSRNGGNPRVFDRGLMHCNRVMTPVAAGGVTIWYKACIPLHSAILGKYAKLAAPACEWSPASFQIQITWAQQYMPATIYQFANQTTNAWGNPATGAAGTMVYSSLDPNFTKATANNNVQYNWTIRNINFVHKMIVMPAEIAGVVLTRQPNADTTMALRMWRHYTMPRLTAGINTYTFIVPARIQSANAIFFFFRASNPNHARLPSYKRMNPGFSAFGTGNSVQLRLGTEYLPTQAITSGMELYAECLKANNKLKSANGDTQVDHVYYFGNAGAKLVDGQAPNQARGVTIPFFQGANPTQVAGPPAPYVYPWITPDNPQNEAEYHALYVNWFCGFYVAFDTDTFTASTESSRSGLYLANNTLTLEMKMAVAPDENYTLDCFIVHDADMVIRATGLTQTFY